MRKALLFLFIGLLFISCSEYKTYTDNSYPSVIKIYYEANTKSISQTYTFLTNNENIPHAELVNNRIFGTYKTTINPRHVGYDESFYDIDTNTVFMCKFKYTPDIVLLRRNKYNLYDFKVMINDSIIALDIPLFEIIEKKAFNELKF